MSDLLWSSAARLGDPLPRRRTGSSRIDTMVAPMIGGRPALVTAGGPGRSDLCPGDLDVDIIADARIGIFERRLADPDAEATAGDEHGTPAECRACDRSRNAILAAPTERGDELGWDIDDGQPTARCLVPPADPCREPDLAALDHRVPPCHRPLASHHAHPQGNPRDRRPGGCPLE